MLERKFTGELRRWKASHGAECLFLRGARQVGKSYAVEAFGRSDYASLVTLDFIKNPAYKEVFSGDLDAGTVYERLSLFAPGARVVPGDTLLFLDEVQECPRARTALKYLAQDGRCDVVASGSLLGIAYREETADTGYSVSVGYERRAEMLPLDFEEFLWALGYSAEATAALRRMPWGPDGEPRRVPDELNSRMMGLLREYLAVGGMPAVVEAWAERRDWGEVHEAQRSLSASYLDDVAKYAPPEEKAKARACYLSLPQQLAKENTKFQWSVVQRGASARKYRSSVDWLLDAEMAVACRRASAPLFPLAAYESRDAFRLYASDTGLLMALYPFEMKRAVVTNELAGHMKGGLYENLAALMLRAGGDGLRYWMSADSNYEVEFLLDRAPGVVPLEVKAGRGSTASLNRLLESEPGIPLAYKLVDGNAGRAGRKVTLPLWACAFLPRG